MKIFRKVRKRKKLERTLEYRELHNYNLDVIIEPEANVHIPKALISEPDEGICYKFGPSGYKFYKGKKHYSQFPCSNRNFNNYSHWTVCEVPLLHLALDAPVDKVYIPADIWEGILPYQERWWEILMNKFPNKQVIPLPTFQKIKAKYVPFNHDTSACTTELIGKTPYMNYHRRKATPYTIKLFNSLGAELYSGEHSPEYIYIVRNKRTLKNDNEVQKLLKSYGFTCVSLEDLSLDEQINLFRKAKCIVGFHGAGLANLLFCESNTIVLEIVDPDCVYPSYKDGLIYRGRRAPRTHFHDISFMKGMHYVSIASSGYVLSLKDLEAQVQFFLSPNHVLRKSYLPK